MKIKVGDRLRFRKFDWVIVSEHKSWAGVTYYKYRVYRRYFKGYLPLSNTNCTQTIFPWRWEFCKAQLKENPNWHYTMNLWSGQPRSGAR